MHFVFVLFLMFTTQSSYAATKSDVVVTSLQMHEYTILYPRWNKIVDIYYNPANIPSGVFASDSRLAGLAPAAREEMQNKIIEELILFRIKYLNTIRGTNFYARYRGRTSLDCGNSDDGIVIYCWMQGGFEGERVAGEAFVTLRNGSIPYDGSVKLNALLLPSLPYETISFVIFHETGHLLGLGHEDEVVAVMNSRGGETIEAESFYQDDLDGFRALYAVGETCGPTIYKNKVGVPYFNARILYEDELYQGTFEYRDTGGLGSLVITAAELLPAGSTTNCALKLNGDILHFPYIKLNGTTNWLDVQVTPTSFLIKAFGVVEKK